MRAPPVFAVVAQRERTLYARERGKQSITGLCPQEVPIQVQTGASLVGRDFEAGANRTG